jgi:hypothetical protein
MRRILARGAGGSSFTNTTPLTAKNSEISIVSAQHALGLAGEGRDGREHERRRMLPAGVSIAAMGGRRGLAAMVAGVAAVAPAAAHHTETTAMFARTSYAPQSTAELRVTAGGNRLTVQPLSALPARGGRRSSIFHDPPVGPARIIRWRPGTHTIRVRIGAWPSGVYFFRVRGEHEGQAVAPVVVRPPRLGTARVAVVVPTYTWQAYNRRGGDSWYACSCVHTVDLDRPHLHAGVPYNFAQYDRAFFAWLATEHKRADVLTDEDLDAVASGDQLRRAYRLVVFEGHGEYVTSHMYDVAQRYRDLGGHLMFLSANNFFRRVDVHGHLMTLVGEWRALGRPEAALIGGQYIDWFRNRYHNRQYVVVGARRLPWLFARTRLRNGRRIAGHFGIEIDGLAPSSPRGTIVAADIPNIFPHETAQMTYYATRAGAEVFNAGTIDFGGAADVHDVSAILLNLWRHMG